MSGIPGIRNPIARVLISIALSIENFARWWNREPPIARGGVVRMDRGSKGASLFPPINHRDRAMGFDRRRETPVVEVSVASGAEARSDRSA